MDSRIAQRRDVPPTVSLGEAQFAPELREMCRPTGLFLTLPPQVTTPMHWETRAVLLGYETLEPTSGWLSKWREKMNPAVASVQRLINILRAQADEPRITENGRFSKDLTELVKQHQREMGLPDTGIVNRPTIEGLIQRTLAVDESATRSALMNRTFLWELAKREGKRNGIEPAVVFAITETESSFDPLAHSKSGAKGIMQLSDLVAKAHGVTDVWDPEQNIAGGAKELRFLSDKFQGELWLIAAAYNAGSGRVDQWRKRPEGLNSPDDIPFPETKSYVARVLANYERYKAW